MDSIIEFESNSQTIAIDCDRQWLQTNFGNRQFISEKKRSVQ